MGKTTMGKKREEEISFLLHKEIATMICILLFYIPYQCNLLSLFNFVLPSVLILTFSWGAGAKYVQTAVFRRKARSLGKRGSCSLAKKKKKEQLVNLLGTCKEKLNVSTTEGAGAKYEQNDVFRRKARSPGKRGSRLLAKKKQLVNLLGTYTEIGYGKEKLYVSTTEICKGSNSIIIFEGVYQGRKVAVKRLSKALHNLAFKEVQHLIVSDQHPNIIRWHGEKHDRDYVYLVLEQNICSLSDLISVHADSPQNAENFARQTEHTPRRTTTVQDINLWNSDGYPSALLLKLMRDMVHGLAHLHKLGIHQDIKPHNVMIAEGEDICAKLSDIGSSDSRCGKKFHKRQGCAADMYSLGCVFFFCLTRGLHCVKKNTVNLNLLGHMPEAADLLSRLLHLNPEMRPTASQVLHHPLFWTSDMRLSFIRDVSDRLKQKSGNCSSNIKKSLEKVAHQAFDASWDKKIDQALIKDISYSCGKAGKHYGYKYNKVQHLLRAIRNKLNHYYESPQTIQELLGPMPEGLDDYFRSRFPGLVMEVYKVIIKNCQSEKTFEKYFGIESAYTV